MDETEVVYGTIGMLPLEEYNPDKQYEILNLVSFDGSSYVVHTKPPIGTLPTNLDYWQVSALGTSKATANSVGTVKPDGTTTEVSVDGSLSAKTATQNTPGVVKGSNGIKVETDGRIDVNTLFEQATELANIIAGEAIASVFGKIAKSIAVTMGLNENALLKNMLTNMDANDQNKIPTSAFVHTLYERIGMGTELTAGANLTAGLNTLNSNLTDFRDQYRKAISLPDDTDINTLIIPGTYNVYTTIDSKKYRWIVVVDWCDASSVSLSRQTAYYYLGSGPMAPITRYQYNTGSGYAWSQWYYMDYHARINLTTGYISGMVNDKISQGYKGGDIALGSYAPPDTYSGNQYGTIKWTVVFSDIAYLQFLVPRSTAIITRAISASESYDTGWVVH